MIPYGRQDISDDDIADVVETLKSAFLTQGPAVEAFEEAVATYCGANHAVSANSATSALHIACLALGVGTGDLVWTTPNTFVASANCARYCGADVDFVDIDPLTLNMSADRLAEKLATAKHKGRLPKVVIPVHFSGRSADMAAIGALRDKYGFRVIEDASHAIGGRYRNTAIGACPYSDIAVFSFHPVKIVTSGEGGMALTNDAKLAEQMALFRSHGVTREPRLMQEPTDGPWSYQMVDLGLNYRLTDIQATLGLAQMRRLDPFVQRRNALAARYNVLLADLPITRPAALHDGLSAWHLYVIQTENRRAVYDQLRASGIGVNVHYIPVHLQPYYRDLGFNTGDFPASEAYYDHAITIPLFAAMTDAEQDRVVACLAEALR
ncbi:MAG: UDP-4-amino-4,6-dideoxy-N-acetyl-beta-L-altrosamine transaminase [Alphaproteobacteria bacterium]